MVASRQAEYTVLADRQMLYTGSQSGPINSQLVTSPLRPWVNSSALQQKQDPSPIDTKDNGKTSELIYMGKVSFTNGATT